MEEVSSILPSMQPCSLQHFFLSPSSPSVLSSPHFPSFSPVVSHMSALGVVNISPVHCCRGRYSACMMVEVVEVVLVPFVAGRVRETLG